MEIVRFNIRSKLKCYANCKHLIKKPHYTYKKLGFLNNVATHVKTRTSQVKEIKILKQRAVTTNPGTKTPIYPGRML